MRRFAQLRTGLSAARINTCPSRLYSVEHGNTDVNSTKGMTETQQGTSSADEPDLDALFNFGDNLPNVDHHNKTINTVVGSLPISPLLDPAWRKARKPHKKQKPPPVDKMRRFQRNMKRNPYAQMLAEPVRHCHVTRARLPRPFLQGFGIVAHPETNDLWWIPAGFEEPSKGSAANLSEKAEAQIVNEDEVMPSSDSGPTNPVSLNEPKDAATADNADAAAEQPRGHQDASKGEAAPRLKPAATLPVSPDEFATTLPPAEYAETAAEAQGKPPSRQDGVFRAPAHVLARQDLLMEFLDKQSKHSGGHFRFGSIQSIGKLVGKATWRQDMHEVLREHMRRGIVDELIEVSRTCENGDRNNLIKIETPQDSLKYQNCNCFMRLTGKYTPFDYMGVPGVPGSALPIYYLPELLGAEQMQRLISASPLFADDSLLREGTLMLMKGKGNVELNKKLWKLQGFLADYVEPS